MKLSAALNEFLRYQRLRNNSPATIETYTVVISKVIVVDLVGSQSGAVNIFDPLYKL